MKAKKLIAFLVVLSLTVFILSGCGGGQQKPQEPAQSGNAADAEPTDDYNVAVLTMRKMTTPADLNTMEGIDKLETELGIKIKIIECVEISEYKEQVQAVSEGGYDVVYFIYDNFLEAVKELAPSYPDIKYIGLWIDLPKGDEIDNLKPLFFKPQQGAFMCGVVAALTSETGKVGFIGGGINPGIVTFLAGYEAGIKYVDNGTELVVSWANTFEDPLKGKELASSLYNRDVDIIFQVANQTGLGVIDAAKEMGKYAIGVDVDQSPLAPKNVIASCLLDHGYATYDSVKQAYEGKFNNSQVYYGLEEGTPVIAINKEIVSQEVQDKVAEIEQRIIKGEIEIPKTTETK